MAGSVLDVAFAHHVWATLKVFDACRKLSPEQLETNVPGTYGTILDTARHIVAADASYLWVTTRGRVPRLTDEQEETMELAELRDTMAGYDRAWADLLAAGPDPEEVVVRHRDDGSSTSAPFSIRLAQVPHHGTDHRSQICTALTTLGIEPPPIDLWDYGAEIGIVTDTPPTS